MNPPTSAAEPIPASSPPPPPAASERPRMPPQIKYIIGNEGCERFSFYGMRSILTVFMSGATVVSATNAVPGLGFSEPEAKSIYHTFVAACYLFPLLGGFLADRLLGKYRVILYLSLLYCAGHAALSIWENRFGLYLGLSLIALGAGGIKPCVSAFVGDQFTEANKSLVKRVFGLFYWIINFGSFFSTLLIPYLRAHYGNSVAFGLPGVLMAVATVVFFLGRRHYRIFVPRRHRAAGEPPASASEVGTRGGSYRLNEIEVRGGGAGAFTVIAYALAHRGERRPGQSTLDVARARYGDEVVDGVRAALRIAVLFATVSVFWALFDQHGSSWVLQARRMDLDVNLFGRHVTFLPSQVSAFNPAIVMILIPVFTLGLYPLMERLGTPLTPLRRMTLGMFFAALSFVAVAFIQFALDGGARPNVLWQVVPYAILTIAEVLISVTGLEFAYTQAPPSMKSTIMSFWNLTVFIGNVLTAQVERLNVFRPAQGFLFYAALMFAVAIVFGLQARRYKVADQMVGDAKG